MKTRPKPAAWCGFALLLVLAQHASASPQGPDRLVLHGDTIGVFQLPLDAFLQNDPANYYLQMMRHPEREVPLNYARGYQATWALKGDSLWLDDFNLMIPDPFGLPDQEVMVRMFGRRLEGGRVFAGWFSSTLVVPLGPMLRWDHVFSRTYTQERILSFDRGVLVGIDTVDNYIPIRGRELRMVRDDLNRALLPYIRSLDWDRLHGLECDSDYEVTISTSGAVSAVRDKWGQDVSLWHEPREWTRLRRCSRAIKRALSQVRFDIVKWHGVAAQEIAYLELYYDQETGILEDIAISDFDE